MAEIMVPTLSEFREGRRLRRRAYLACIGVFHLTDHLKKLGGSGMEDAIRR